jgi:serine/threonine protein kinase
MGSVWIGTSPEGKHVAIKFNAVGVTESAGKSRAHERFQREIEVLAKLEHPHVAGYVAHGTDEGHDWFAMEFIQGSTWESLITGPMPPAIVLRWGLQIARALQYADERTGLIHRDVKPSNIIIVGHERPETSQAVLVDFGLAKIEDDTGEKLTMTGVALGTPHCMSPEQIRGEAVDVRTDIYALACTMAWALRGEPLFAGRGTATMVMAAHLKEPIPSIQAPEGVVALITMATHKKRQDRYPAWRGFIVAAERALEACGHGTGKIHASGTRRISVGGGTTRFSKTENTPSSTRVHATEASTLAATDHMGETSAITTSRYRSARRQSGSWSHASHGEDATATVIAPTTAPSAVSADQTDRIQRQRTSRIERSLSDMDKIIAKDSHMTIIKSLGIPGVLIIGASLLMSAIILMILIR